MDDPKNEEFVKIHTDVKLRKRKGPIITSAKKGDPTVNVGLKSAAADAEDESKNEKQKINLNKRVSFPGKDVSDETAAAETTRSEPKTAVKKKGASADTCKQHDIRFLVLSMRDFVLYVIYLFLIMIVAFGERDDAFNYYAQVLSDLILKSEFEMSLSGNMVSSTFRHIENANHFWAFVEHVLFPVFYGASGSTPGPIMQESIMVGVPQMKQKRVQSGSCDTAPLFEDLFKSCYGYYTSMNEQTVPYRMVNSTPWIYESLDDSLDYHGTLGSYSSGGYIFNFSTDSNFSHQWIQELRENDWIDRATRAIFIDFTLYSQNLRLYCIASLVFEFSPSGNVFTSSEFNTMKFMRYNYYWDYFILSCELAYLAFTVYFIIEEAQQLYEVRWQYFDNSWNFLDLLVAIMGIIIIISGINKATRTRLSSAERVGYIGTQYHEDFEFIASHQVNFNVCMAGLVFAAWLKLLKFSTLNRAVYVILCGIGNVRDELIALTCITLFISVGFSILGNVLFGTHVKQFYTVSDSIFTLNGFYAGGLYFYEDCIRSCPTIAPIYFCVYVLIVAIFFMNCFLALMVHGIGLSFVDEEEAIERKYFNDLAREAFIRLLVRLKLYRLMKRFRAREMISDSQHEYDAFVRVLDKRGCRGIEQQLILRQHKIIRGSRVDFNAMKEAYDDICVRNQLSVEVEEHAKIMNEVERVEQLMESCDQTIADLMIKVEILSDRISRTLGPLKGPLKR